MTKDTKEIIIQTLINIVAEGNPLTIEEISRQSGITRTTIQRNFDNKGIQGIIYFMAERIITEIDEELVKHNPDELPLEIFADIVLPILWKHYREAHTIYSFPIPYPIADMAVELSFSWVKKRYEYLVISHSLIPFSARDLLYYWNIQLFTVCSIWLGTSNPLKPEEFKPKFIYLMKTSLYDLIYKDIGLH